MVGSNDLSTAMEEAQEVREEQLNAQCMRCNAARHERNNLVLTFLRESRSGGDPPFGTVSSSLSRFFPCDRCSTPNGRSL